MGPAPPSLALVKEGTTSPQREEVPPAIAKACDLILHYVGGGGFGGVSEDERATRQQARYDRRNAGCRSAFAKMGLASKWVRNYPDLAVAWALDRSVTTVETSAG
ncbi:Importin subunit beta-1 [Hordeum vulgare]|nr:Importin subunit beta-1 [Hordeum vulgare]